MHKLAILFILIFTFTACKKKGCTDNRATNYNQDAEKDDGSCLYDTIVIAPDTTNYRLQLIPVFGNEDFELNKQYLTNIGDKIKFEELKFYLSEINLIKTDDSKESIADVILIDLRDSSSLIVERSIADGSYKSVEFNLGLTKELNSQDPATFLKSHPLSTFKNMYWTWSTQYKFGVIEGRTDTLNSGSFNHTFLYHLGTDTLLREVLLDNKNIDIVENDDVTNQTLKLDVKDIFFSGNDTINVRQEFLTHTTNDFELSVKVQNNFSNAFE